ncbi:MAG: hypothetical protein WC054_14525 [Candidatus Nanopelagicales bacterium]
MLLTDLFGQPIQPPPWMQPEPSAQQPKKRKAQSLEAKRRKMLRRELANATPMLFPEIMEWLARPVFSPDCLPKEFRFSDRRNVRLLEETGEEIDPDECVVPYASWGTPWIEDAHGMKWSREGLVALQNFLFWESMEEMTLINNSHDKWSVVKWVFMPAIRKYYVFDKRIGRSHCLEEHERDQTFSFHNCCIAARVTEDLVRNGFRRNLPAELMTAVTKVFTFS